MAIVFEEIATEIEPPTPARSTAGARAEGSAGPPVDPQSLIRELERVADRAERLNAD
jgi:hypothetical protein